MIVALNNKCNLNKNEFIDYINKIIEIKTNNELILCPSTINIGTISDLKQDVINIGAQDVSCMEDGAHTGEISAEQLKSYGVRYCIVGHSERREEQNETYDEINQKIKELLKQDIIPILCIGETLEERKANNIKKVLENEISSAIKDIPPIETKKIILAYEPIWSIGTGFIPTNTQIDFTVAYIKKILPNSKVLYGGSANEENIDILKKNKQIDGFLLGGLSLKPDKLQKFLTILD